MAPGPLAVDDLLSSSFSIPRVLRLLESSLDRNATRDEDIRLFRIDVVVRNDVWGALFGYSGRFTVDYVPAVPPSAVFVHQERSALT